MATAVTLFDTLFVQTDEQAKMANKGIVKNRNARAIQAAIDSARDQKTQAEANRTKVLAVITRGDVLDVNQYLGCVNTINRANETIAALKALYSDLFGKEYQEETV
jgi:hypothetical protein